MEFIDSLLNRITAYRLLLQGLGALMLLSIVFAFLGWLPYTALDLLLSAAILLFAARAANGVCALYTKAAPAPESAYITALILFFILTPLQSAGDAVILMAVAALAMLSKYIFAPYKVPLFNPAAIAVFVTAIFMTSIVTWWVANPILLPFVVILGLLVIRKMRYVHLALPFFLVSTLIDVGYGFSKGISPVAALSAFFFTTPVIFVGMCMLTEPQTAPKARGQRIIYGILTGIFFPLSFTIGALTASPEFAVLVGNVYAFFVSLRKRATLSFFSMKSLGRGVYEFAFIQNSPLPFTAGQHAEFSLPHAKSDGRGTRRFFSIASAPSDPFIRLHVTIPVESSTFKDALKGLEKDQIVSALSGSGELTLPKEPTQPIAYLAAHSGITPFMSIFRELALQGARRDMVLIYIAPTPLDFVYQQEIEAIKEGIGLQVVYLPTGFLELSDWTGPSGYLTNLFIKKQIPDYAERQWYVAGPDELARDHVRLLHTMGISRSSIRAEYFPGF